MKILSKITETIYTIYKTVSQIIVTVILLCMSIFGGTFSLELHTKQFIEKVKAFDPYTLFSIFIIIATFIAIYAFLLHLHITKEFYKKHNIK